MFNFWHFINDCVILNFMPVNQAITNIREITIMIKKLFYKYKEIIMYIIVGGFTTLVNWIAYAACTNILPIKNTEKLILFSNTIAWIAAVLFAYIANKRWVFESKTNSVSELVKELISFIGARLLTGLMEIFGVPLLVVLGLNQTIFDIEGFLAKILVSVIVTVLNYVFGKLFIFKKTNHPEKKKDSTAPF